MLNLQAKPPTIYKAVVKARQHDHEVLYTPPYHPELKPTEMIWGPLKNRIALDPASSVEDLGEKIEAGLQAIGEKQWQGTYKKIQFHERAYLGQQPPLEVTQASTTQALQQYTAQDVDGPSPLLVWER
ncbi:unnamed protein product [Phytophthora fragariaefolia]|uniref:Unnamed protein product n=1 Tax=Phytophthora fragariaefolia TaxID=1490495 RepID=A0A9W6Y754_9STRA|nr:unnamed protein product [Phytophthora fragariaefolia]